jgi:hypothetical protein
MRFRLENVLTQAPSPLPPLPQAVEGKKSKNPSVVNAREKKQKPLSENGRGEIESREE